MKNLVIILVLACVVSGCVGSAENGYKHHNLTTVTEKEKSNNWKIGNYVDRFGDDTGEHFIYHSFNNSSDLMYCDIMVDSSTIRIRNAINKEIEKIDATLYVKDCDGIEYKFSYSKGYIYGDEYFTYAKGVYNSMNDLFDAIKKEGDITFAFDCGERGKGLQFKLKINTYGFNEKFAEL